MRQGRNFRAGHLLDASGERTIFSMTEIPSLSLLYGCGENMSIKNLRKSKNIDEVYQSVFFRCIMLLSYRVTFLCNVFSKFIIHQKALCDIFL